MTYAVTYKDYLTETNRTEYGGIKKVKYLVEWLEEHQADYELLNIEPFED